MDKGDCKVNERESCCKDNPGMLCKVCNDCACVKHLRLFKRNHPVADQLTSTGRETFWCREVLVTFAVVDAVVILMSLEEITKG